MDGSDMSAAALQKLKPQMRVAAETFGNGRGDARTQFARRRARKGDDQKPVDALRRSLPVLRIDISHQTFGQNTGLAASGAGGYQHTAAPAEDGLAL